jgi:ABC-2 type transport system permease protein
VVIPIRKWRSLFSIYLQDSLAYRASAVIWILTDTLPAMIMPLVFISAMPTGGSIAGFSAASFVTYYLVMLLLTNFITSHIMWDLAYEIRDGLFTVHLVRPISYFQVCFMRNLTWRIMRVMLFAPFFVLFLWGFRGYLETFVPYLGWETWAAIVLGHLVSFTFILWMAMLALFFTEIQSIFGLYYIPMLFLSGQLFPIGLLPDWAANIARYMPFYYTTAMPTELIVGRLLPADAHPMLLMQVGFIGVQLLVAHGLWRWGLRYYTGVGM